MLPAVPEPSRVGHGRAVSVSVTHSYQATLLEVGAGWEPLLRVQERGQWALHHHGR